MNDLMDGLLRCFLLPRRLLWKYSLNLNIVPLEGLARDIAQFFSLSIPKAVWEKTKQFQNDALVRFIEECRNWK
jgi:hypothetical protein